MDRILCKRSNDGSDVRCAVCGQGFLVFWSRFSRQDQQECRRHIQDQLRKHHSAGVAGGYLVSVHREEGFTIPEWTGYSALLGGLRPGTKPLSLSGMFNIGKVLEESF